MAERFVIVEVNGDVGAQFHDVSNAQRKNATSAVVRLLAQGINKSLEFHEHKGTLVDGLKKNSREHFNSDLQLRIDNQGNFNQDGIAYANVQIQLNIPNPPSTIAQVFFPIGKSIGDSIVTEAFEQSLERRRRVFVKSQN